MQFKRGDIVFVNFNPAKGKEVGKFRPAVIMSSDEDIAILPTIIVIPLSSILLESDLPHRVSIPARSMLSKDSEACVSEIRAIDPSRILERLGSISEHEYEKLKTALFEVLS